MVQLRKPIGIGIEGIAIALANPLLDA